MTGRKGAVLPRSHMNRVDLILRRLLILGTGFLGLTAVPGGAMLLFGIYSPPLDMLRGSVFRSFTVPGLALAVGVGGSALLAMTLLVRRSRLGYVCAAMAGLVVMTFEFVQVLSIGSPAGPSRNMQVLYFALGALLVATALAALLQAGSPEPLEQSS